MKINPIHKYYLNKKTPQGFFISYVVKVQSLKYNTYKFKILEFNIPMTLQMSKLDIRENKKVLKYLI